MFKVTLEDAEISSRSGFNVTYDGDSQTVLYATGCNHCGNCK